MHKGSDHKTQLIALGMIILGLLLVLVGYDFHGKFDFGKISVSVGSTIIFIGVLHWLYDAYTKKALHAELLEVIMGSKSVADSGAIEFHDNSIEINFKRHLSESSTLVALFSYNPRFMLDYEIQIDELLGRGGTAKLIFLHANSSTIANMKALGWEENSIAAAYTKIERFQQRLQQKHGTRIEVHFVDAILRYSAVKLDSSIFLIFSTCSNVRQVVPAVRVRARSVLGEFISKDLARLIEVGE
jgi:hypothetical protein